MKDRFGKNSIVIKGKNISWRLIDIWNKCLLKIGVNGRLFWGEWVLKDMIKKLNKFWVCIEKYWFILEYIILFILIIFLLVLIGYYV